MNAAVEVLADSVDSIGALSGDDQLLAAVPDDHLAAVFAERFASRARYCAFLGRWLLWDGTRWRIDDRLRAFDMARGVCRDECATRVSLLELTARQRATMRLRLGSAQTVAAVLKLAAADRRLAVSAAELDSDPWLLNTPGGVVDLRTGRMRPHEPGLMLTKTTAAAPEGECPLFARALARALPDPEVRDYVQRFFGYALTGVVREHVLPFFFGTGRNGKSLLVNAVRFALGDYGKTVNPDLLTETHTDRHPCEIASLRGVRFAIATEIDTGRRWNESRLKRLTGGDTIAARFIGQDPFEFEPTHKLLVVANAKPALRAVDEAIRGRIHLVRFETTIPEHERDATLPEKLRAEAGGILAWAIQGCLSWQAVGLRPPRAVLEATEAYLASEDHIDSFVGEMCSRSGQITLSAIHAAYRDWAGKSGVPALGRNTFGDLLEAKGFKRVETRRRVFVFDGLSLPVHEAPRYGS